jgi:hypothetical protein
MKLRTEIQISPSSVKIDHFQKLYFTGSCFSENIADKFKYFGFDVLANSHGIIYNPVSIENSILDLTIDKPYEHADLNQYNGKYFSYAHHGIFSNHDPEQVLSNINETISLHGEHLKKASFVFITFGTAWVYTELLENVLVANCHKIPGSHFKKRLLTESEIGSAIQTIINRIRTVNEDAEIVFTVSPVKHLKDGFIENQLSKSLLNVCIHTYLDENITYFPAYEIMNDDLRDYRFWKEDMMHPNDLAIEYIWQKFSEVYFSDRTLEIMKEVKQYRQLASHKPLSSNLNEISELEDKKKTKHVEIKNKYPQLIL